MMKRIALCWIVLLAHSLSTPAHAADGAQESLSREELESAVQQLSDPATEMTALRRLIKFSGHSLYNSQLVFVTGDAAADKLRNDAARAVHSHRSLASVTRALESADRDVRYWGIVHFQSSRWDDPRKDGPWRPLLPRLQELAAHDKDEGIRGTAIERLQGYKEADVFLTKLQESPDETHPWVLMRLLKFNSEQPELRARWYARAVKFLSAKDDALRLLWLGTICGNVSNPSTAPMWKIEAEPALVEALRQIVRNGSMQEQELARESVTALEATSPRR